MERRRWKNSDSDLKVLLKKKDELFGTLASLPLRFEPLAEIRLTFVSIAR